MIQNCCFFLRKYNTSALLLFIFVVIVSLFSSCKDQNTIGKNLLPQKDRINLKTAQISASYSYTYREDSIKSDEVSAALLGSYVDPIFGKTNASIITQFVLGQNNPFLGTNPKVDSIILSLAYNGSYYGDVTKSHGLQKLKVFEITKDIYKDSTYQSKRDLSKYYDSSNLLTESSVLPDPTGKYTSNPTYLKIALPNSFGQHFLDNQFSILNNGLLLSFFKGLYIQPDNDFQTSSEGAILYFNLINTAKLSTIAIYFHSTDTSVTKTFIMDITADCARINFFNHTYTNPWQISPYNDSTSAPQNIYIQSMAGVSGKICLNDLLKWKDSIPVVITKAELILTPLPDITGIYPPPTRLLLLQKDINGAYKTPTDFDLGDTYYNGYYSYTTFDYRFNIARLVQDIINGKQTLQELYLIPSASAINANRVVLKGGANIKINITYTKL